MPINDCHCHFFSRRFFERLAQETGMGNSLDPVSELGQKLEWEPPESAENLAERWIVELDQNQVDRAALIASIPGDEESVAAALSRFPQRVVGFFYGGSVSCGHSGENPACCYQTWLTLCLPVSGHASV